MVDTIVSLVSSLFSIATSFAIQMLVFVIAVGLCVRATGMVRYIPNDRLGILEKIWSARGSIAGGLIARAGEAGYQPATLRGGFHFFLPLQYRIHLVPLVTIPQGQVGYVFARDGTALPPTQTLASNVDADNFEDAAAFLAKGGQKGPQRKVLREGTYAVNLALFVVLTKERNYGVSLDKGDGALIAQMAELIGARSGFDAVVIKDADDLIGVVTAPDGPALPDGEIIAPSVGADVAVPETFHNNFQDPEKFLRAGGFRGRQYQVLVDGSYYINRLFATVELIRKTVVDVGTVGVIVSYTGKLGTDLSGDAYRHGELVEPGFRGVWNRLMLPGKYAFNTYAGKVITVPTTNFVLKWASDTTGPHKLDENLSEVGLITRDAFEPSLPLSVVVHIDYMKAPLVVQRFGDIKRLVEQTLDPMVSAYFKNIAQTKTLIELIQERSDIQLRSGEEMRTKFAAYSLELQEVLIGTPRTDPARGTGIEQILTQLRSRQIAVEQAETYKLQENAAVQERSLKEKQALAEQQAGITASSLAIQIKENEGRAKFAAARQEAETIQVIAKANADRTRVEAQGEADRIRATGLAEAERTRAVGLASAEATEKQVAAYGGPQYQLHSQVLMRFAQAVETGKLALVPNIVVGGSGGQGSANLVEAMLAMLLDDRARPHGGNGHA